MKDLLILCLTSFGGITLMSLVMDFLKPHFPNGTKVRSWGMQITGVLATLFFFSLLSILGYPRIAAVILIIMVPACLQFIVRELISKKPVFFSSNKVGKED